MKQFFIIDAIGFLFRSFFAIKGMKAPDGTPTNALYGFIRSIEKLFQDFPIAHGVAIFDGPQNKASRSAIYPDYKGHRSQMPDELFSQLALAHEFCQLYGIPLLSIPRVEADDVIGSVARWALKEGFHIHIVSQDKDLAQLVSPHIDLIQPHKDNLIVDEQKVVELYGVQPSQMVDYLAIIGDSSDNIPGISGIGPKTAVKLLEQFSSLDHLYKNLDLIDSDKKRQQIFDAKELAFLSRELAKLDLNVPIPESLSEYTIQKKDTPALFHFYEKYGFKSLMKDLAGDKSAPKPVLAKTEVAVILSSKELKHHLDRLKSHDNLILNCTPIKRLDHLDGTGIGIGAAEEKTIFIPLGAPGESLEWISLLRHFFDQGRFSCDGHDLKSILHQLDRHGLSIPKIGFDTMLASYVVNPENNRHTLQHLCQTLLDIELPITEGDAALCAAQIQAVQALKSYFEKTLVQRKVFNLFHQVDSPLIEVLFAMEKTGIHVDISRLQELSLTLTEKIAELEKAILALAGRPFNIKSPKQLSEVLFEELKIPTKAKKTTLGFSTSIEVLESLIGKHPIIEAVIQYRTLEKLRSTYVDALPLQINPTTGRIHCTFNQMVTATGRLSCQDPNLQNIPVRSEWGQQIRSAFCPANPKDILLAADYSQIELRILAHLSQDPTLIHAFQNDHDIHQLTASLIFDCDKQAVTPAMRNQAKAVNFGIIYGQSAFGLSKELGIPVKEAGLFIEKYFERYPKVLEFMNQEKEKGRQYGYAESLMGRKRDLPDINSKNPMLRGQAERYAINTPIQGTQSDLMKMAMVAIHQKMMENRLKSKMLLQIHDELIFEVASEEKEGVEELVRKIMENIYPMSVPLKVNILLGKNWGEC